MSGTLYVIDKLGSTIAELERRLAEAQAENEQLRAQLAQHPSSVTSDDGA